MRRGCIHSTETDGLQDGHQRGPNGSGSETRRSSGKGRGERSAAEGTTGNPRTCSEKYRVTCKGTGMREIASRRPTDKEKLTRRTVSCSVSYSSRETFHLPACSPPSDLSSLSNGGTPNISLAVNRHRGLLKISLHYIAGVLAALPCPAIHWRWR